MDEQKTADISKIYFRRTHPQRQRPRVHGPARPGVAESSWCEDFVYQAWLTLGEWHHRELLLYCSETIFWNGKRLTRCSRPRCYSNGGGRTPKCLGLPTPGARGVAAPCVRLAYASANARSWSIGGQNPNLRTGVIHGGRSILRAMSTTATCSQMSRNTDDIWSRLRL